jgi:hypothetical protein
MRRRLVALNLRAAARDAACPLVEVLREEVQGIQRAILKDLQEARDMVVERKAELDMESVGEPFHALYRLAELMRATNPSGWSGRA